MVGIPLRCFSLAQNRADTGGGLLHDVDDLGVVYEVVTLPQNASRLTRERFLRKRREHSEAYFDSLFDEMDRLSRKGAELLQAAKWQELGSLMNICHGLLNAIGVSTPELERMVALARQSGASGAKLTGAGGGGSIVALCPGNTDVVEAELLRAGYQTLVLPCRNHERT